LKAERPWSPTGVAVHGGNIYVLEYTNANGSPNDGWLPRVRRLGREGSVKTLFTAADGTGAAAPPNRPVLVPAPGSPIAATGGSLTAGDVNGDGCADLVLVAGKSLKVFFGGANRVWKSEPDVSTDLAGGGSEMALADVNHDGRQDLVLADHDSYAVAVLLGSGDGKFLPATDSPFPAREGTQPHTHGLAIADFNGDGHLDIATANNTDGDISLLLGDGKGKFVRAAKSPFACGKSPYPIAATDINGDGHVDVLVPNAAHGDDQAKTLTILQGNGKGELAPAANSPVTCDSRIWLVATGDLNGDQRPDVVATHSEGGSGVTILLNAAGGKLSPAAGSPLKLAHGAWGAKVADMNRDGNADLVVAADEHIRVFQGDGRGGFKPAEGSPFKTGKGAWRLTVADFNGDGRLDVATRCVEANRIEIWRGN
jgi:hypothetical protein